MDTIIFKAVNIEKLKKFLSEEHPDLKEKIFSSKRFLKMKNEFISAKFWLEKIFTRKNLDFEVDSEIYAFELIINEIWEKLPFQNDIKIGYESDFIEKFLKEDFWISENLKEIFSGKMKNIFENFENNEKVPDFWIIYFEDLKYLQEIFWKINITEEMIKKFYEYETEEFEEKAYAYERIKGIKENIDFCLEKNCDFVTFFY